MRGLIVSTILAFLIFLPSTSSAEGEEKPPCPPPYAICLTEEEKGKVVDAVKELDDIKSSPAELELKESVVVIRDWQGRVYVNGGDQKPITVKLRIGRIIDRDLEMKLPVHVYERDEPEDPMFRARFRAQIGLMVPEIVRIATDGKLDWFWDGGVSLDFFHYDVFNVSLYVGVQSLGGGLGIDITKNFGIYAGPHLSYQSLGLTAWIGPYFSLN